MVLAPAGVAAAQSTTDTASIRTVADTIALPRPRYGSEILLPMSSLVLPGLGQYVNRAPAAGLAYTGASIVGTVIGMNRDVPDSLDFALDPHDQLADLGWSVAMSSSWLSAWDSFHRSVSTHQRLGRYQFLPKRESLGQLLAAPFDLRHLKRWTTWVDLAQTALVTTLILSEPDSDEHWRSFRGHDAVYAGGVSLNAAVGEEAFFRGYLLPMMYQRSGKFWLANASQATVFGLLHGPAGVLIGPWAFWEGWVTRRNGWSISESIFHHFWYDAVVISAAMLVDDNLPQRTRRIGFSLPF